MTDSVKPFDPLAPLEPIGSALYRRLASYGIHAVVAGWVLLSIVLSCAVTAVFLRLIFGAVTWVDMAFSALVTTIVTVPISYRITGLIFKLNASRESLHRLAQCDVLTGIANRGYFFDRLTGMLNDDKAAAYPMAALMIDADHFKQINDELGHATGDEVIKQLARVLQGTLRNTDFIARYGGEEFVVGLPNTTPAEAFNIAERMRATVSASVELQRSARSHVTVSVGVAVAPSRMSADALMLMADHALYSAKTAGRNCSVLQEESDLRSVTARRRALSS
jgi:diguanylate cyclase (GGDEF)-like protein